MSEGNELALNQYGHTEIRRSFHIRCKEMTVIDYTDSCTENRVPLKQSFPLTHRSASNVCRSPNPPLDPRTFAVQ